MKKNILVVVAIFLIIWGCISPSYNSADEVFMDDGHTITQNDNYGKTIQDAVVVLSLFGYSDDAKMIENSLSSHEIMIKDIDKLKENKNKTSTFVYIDTKVFQNPNISADLTNPLYLAKLFRISSILLHKIIEIKNEGSLYLLQSFMNKLFNIKTIEDKGEFYELEFQINFLDHVIQLMLDNIKTAKKCDDKLHYLQIASSLLIEKLELTNNLTKEKYDPALNEDIVEINKLRHHENKVNKTILEVSEICADQ